MFLAVDKPTRITSFGVIRRIKRVFPGQKIGHSGTLDPMATWLMILAVGKDTKNLTKIIWQGKSYIATIDFSIITDTRDMDYWDTISHYEIVDWKLQIEDWKLIDAPSIEKIKKLLDSIIPSASLPLPSFSAKKKDGKRMYDMARKGNHVLEERDMHIMWYEILSYAFPELALRLDVWSWTYIRSIAYWLWQQLWTWWTLTQLKRISIGKYCMDDMKNRQQVDVPEASKELIIKYTEFAL